MKTQERIKHRLKGVCMKRFMWAAVASWLLVACVPDAGVNGVAVDPDRVGDGKDDNLTSRSTMSFEDFASTVYCEADSEVCIVDGDIPLIGEEALRDYYEESLALPNALTAMFFGEWVDSIWDPTERHALTYCVSNKFGDRKQEIVEAMEEAASQWESVAHVTFQYLPDEDRLCNARNPRVLFDVAPAEAAAPYIARAFFPLYPRPYREVLINLAVHDGNAWNPLLQGIYSLTGVLRHELGHVLGFRHEHIRPEASAPECSEGRDYRPLTEYDAKSVMHYPQCNGQGDWSFELTELDHRGSAFFYPDFDRFNADRCAEEMLPDGRLNEACEPLVHQILDLANTASFEVLDDWVGLDVRAVETIIESRDERPFNTLETLRAMPYLADHGLRKMYTYLYIDGRCPVEMDDLGIIDVTCRPVVNRILELANTASFATLDDEVPLDLRAAGNIVAIRKYRPFTSLSELWSVSYVKTTAIQAMYLYTLPDNP
jgi:hypothetical protein